MGSAAAGLKAAALALMVAWAMPVQASTDENACRIMAYGDSLVAAYGIDVEDAFPAELERRLQDAGYACTVIDAGVPGDTSAGGLARVDWALADRPTHVILELGANDALRALPIEQMEDNLDGIVTRLRAEGVDVLLAGMLAPPNLGRDYGDAYARVFTDLADRHEIAFYPFFLDGVAGRHELSIGDGMHPNALGVAVIVERILPLVTRWLDGDATARVEIEDPTPPG